MANLASLTVDAHFPAIYIDFILKQDRVYVVTENSTILSPPVSASLNVESHPATGEAVRQPLT